MKKEKTVKTAQLENQTAMPEVLPKVETEVVDMEKLSKRLESATAYIQKEVSNVAKSFCRIGFKLWEVKDQKLYIGQGYKNISEYGEKVLGFKKSSTANYIAICERFSVQKNGKPTAQLVDNFANFSYGQLSLMLALPEDKLNEVTPEATCKEIRELKQAAKGEAEEPETDEAATPHATPKVCPPIQVFSRVLTSENMPIVIKLLRENIGREMSIYVEDTPPIDPPAQTANVEIIE